LERCRVPRRLAVLQCVDLTTGDSAELTRLVQALGRIPDSTPGEGSRTSAVTLGTSPPVGAPTARGGGRLRGAAAGLLIGAAYGALSALFVYANDVRNIASQAALGYGAAAALAGTVAGALAGSDAKVLLAMVPAVALTGIVWTLAFGTYADVVMTGLVVGGGIVVILVAWLWPRIQRRLGRLASS